MPHADAVKSDFVENPTADDYARAAEHFLRTKELSQATMQVAAALTFRPNDAKLLALFERIASSSTTPLLLAPEGNDVFFGLVAVRALLLARTGRMRDALDRLFAAALFRPSVPFLTWGCAWVRKRKDARKLDPDSLAAHMSSFLVAVGDADAPPGVAENLESAARIAHLVNGVSPSSSLVAMQARLVSALGRREEALALLDSALAKAPSWEIASTLGALAFRGGSIEKATTAFREATLLRPGEAASHLDLGDALLSNGHLDGASTAYDKALAIAPESPWGQASRAFIQAFEHGDDAAVRELARLAHRGGERSRAGVLSQELQAFEAFIPAPEDAIANVVRSLLVSVGGEGSREARISVRVQASRPEPPSAHIAL
ncbi:MAG: tetratricopeptide repeat protein, partial [Polyangiaceae bacterium]